MKTLSLSLLTLLAAAPVSDAALTWEWTFDDTAPASALGDGLLTWSTPDAQALTTYSVTDGTAVPHIGGSPAGYLRIPGYTNPADFAQFTFNGSAPNGGGLYLNQFTVIMDVYIPAPHNWLPFFNTNPGNANDADFYVSPDGALGIGALGYTSGGAVATDAWHRIIFAADLTAGVVTYYLDGAQVFQRVPGEALLDGRFSLYSAADAGPDLILGNEGDTGGIYTREWLLAAFAFTDRTLTSAEAATLGAPNASGIFKGTSIPTPPPLLISAASPNTVLLNWSQPGFLLQRSTDLSTWNPVTGSAALTTYSETAGPKAYFKLTNP